MARQRGIVKLKGNVGDLSFYKSRDGYLVREKTGVDGSRIATDPVFERTRENSAEFGRAIRAGMLLRNALRPLLARTSDGRMQNRLISELMRVVHSDRTSARGLRNVMDGESGLLQGFEFNHHVRLTNTMHAPFSAHIERSSGRLTVDFAPFIPVNRIKSPSGATHFKIKCAGVEVDFEHNRFEISESASEAISLDYQRTPAITLTNTVPANSPSPLFLALGIEFSQIVNGVEYPLRNSAYNALALVLVRSS
jgi:hypothetical protein